MKRKVLVFLAMYIVLMLSTINVAFADYPTYLWGDKNYILCGAHMGYACYIDKSSLVVEEYNPPTYRLAIKSLHHIFYITTIPKRCTRYGPMITSGII